MLKVHFGNSGKDFNPDSWFDSWFDTKYLLTDFSKRMLKDIADCDVLGENLLISKVMGPIPPSSIGIGCKMILFLVYEKNKERFGIPGIHWCGDDLMPYLREAGRKIDSAVFDCDRLIPLFDPCYGEYNDDVLILNSGNTCNDSWSFLCEYADWEDSLDEGKL